MSRFLCQDVCNDDDNDGWSLFFTGHSLKDLARVFFIKCLWRTPRVCYVQQKIGLFPCLSAGSSDESTMGESVIRRMSEAVPSISACGQHRECGHLLLDYQRPIIWPSFWKWWWAVFFCHPSSWAITGELCRGMLSPSRLCFSKWELLVCMGL